ncbi:MAG TPA: TolC family protein [Candidatus Binatia bacterium]|nr:TolC family protein [Candidatus Binatia bacterium]
MVAGGRWLVLAAAGSLAWLPGAGGAQPPAPAGEMTVQELVARALAANPDLQAARTELEAALGRLRQAGLRPNPTLDVGGQKALGPDSNLMIGLTVPLDRGGRKAARVAVAESELQAKQAQLRERERRLAADVRAKAGEYLAARRNLGVTDELLQVDRAALRLIHERVRQGAAPPLEENLMLVEVNRLEATREMQAGRLEVIALQLKALAGMTPGAVLSLRGELAAPAPILDRSEAIGRAIERRPDIEMSRAELAAARARIHREQAEGRWDASVTIGYQRQDFGFMLRGLADGGGTRPIRDVFHYFGAGVSVTLPVLNRNQGNIAAAEAEARAAERRLEFTELIVRQEVSAAFAQYDAARRSLAIYERGVREAARRNLDVVRRTYELGRATLLEVIAEQRRYIDIENGYTEALKQVYDAVVEVERAVGDMRP